MRFKFFTNGQQVVKAIEEILIETNFEETIQPIPLVILDINMPILDGLQTAKKIKQMFVDLNDSIRKNSEESSEPKQPRTIIRPFICHLT